MPDEIDRRIASLVARVDRVGAKLSGAIAQHLRTRPDLMDDLEKAVAEAERILLAETDPQGSA
jgi:hypothetical protein